jgi:Na+-translocating ferredoxin:NAD+ oxidoreductase RnfC subunit
VKEIVSKVREAGVVGAGGGGFPTHVKIDTSVDIVLANGAECEPLLHCNQELMIREAEKILTGLLWVQKATQAKRAIFCLKKKYERAIEAFKKSKRSQGVELFLLGDYYPAGDEFSLVFEVTKRMVPEAGIPLMVGVVVSNVESLYNISNAMEGKPVTERMLTVTGAVLHPLTLRVPIGMTLGECIAIAGGPTVKEFSILAGGPMMGKLVSPDDPVQKTTSGIVVLPSDHPVILKKKLEIQDIVRRAKAACIQCFSCTEMCPRYLLGHRLEPHKIMRSSSYGRADTDILTQAILCCECGVCELYACPMFLSPREMNALLRKKFGEEGVRWPGAKREFQATLTREGRKIPIGRLISRLGIKQYDRPAPFLQIEHTPKRVKIPLNQHTGVAAAPVVKLGEQVKAGQLLGEIPEKKLGARIHASIRGRVTNIDQGIVIEAIEN